MDKTPQVTDDIIASNMDKMIEERTILLESLRALVSEITSETLIGTEEIENGFILKVPLPDQRTQKVYITVDRRDADGENLFQIFTVCAQADPELFEFALKMNMELDYGALAIKNIDEKDALVMVHTQLVRTAQPAEIEKSLLTLAEVGDDLERILTGEDFR
jgi:hypothetical protein